MREFPSGYGIQVTSPMRNFYDLNDARPAGSNRLVFSSEHAFRWTRVTQRAVGRFDQVISSNVPLHDDYLLRFEPGVAYMVWGEAKFDTDSTLVHMFWHTHHDFTTDMLVFSASPDELGLHDYPFNVSRFVNLASYQITQKTAMERVLSRLQEAREKHTRLGRRGAPPLLRCTFEHGSNWEMLPDGKTWQERYHAPPCNRKWTVKREEPFTLVSFHLQRFSQKTQMVWMHTVFYALYVETTPSSP